MNRNEIIQILRQYKKKVTNKYGIKRMGFFGSFARHEADKNSDIDIFIHMTKPDLFAIAGIKEDLEIQLNTTVDLIPYGHYMNDSLKKRIDTDALDV